MPGPFFWFFAVVALVTLVAAVAFAIRPAERTLAILRALCAATIFSDLANFFLGMANGLTGLKWAIERAGGDSSAVVRAVPLLGFAIDAAAELMVGFAAVAVAWLLVAVGLRRQA